MPVKSLSDLCVDLIIRNVSELTSIGDRLSLHHEAVRRILSRVPTADQLHQIELNSPQIADETGPLWQDLIARHFPDSRKKCYVPSHPRNWWKVYRRYKREHEESLEEAKTALKNAFMGIAKDKDENVTKLVESGERRFLPRPPRTGRGPVRTKRPSEAPSTLNFTAGSRTKLTTGKSVMRRVRREAREIGTKMGKLAIPAGYLPARTGQIREAPKAMIEGHRVATQPQFRPTIPSAETSKRAVVNSISSHYAKTKQGETLEYTVISDSDSDDGAPYDDDEFDPVFDHKSKPSRTRAEPSPQKRRLAPPPPFSKSRPATSESPMISSAPKPRPTNNRRPGLLPGKPGAARPSFPTQVKTVALASESSPPRESASSSRPRLRAQQSSPETTPKLPQRSSPPPQRPPPADVPRKRKAVDIFMKPVKKRVI